MGMKSGATRVRAKAHTGRGPSASQAEAQWKSFLARYTPEIAGLMSAAREKLLARIPRGFELVYDNYNALATGFSPADRSSAAVISLAAYPRWVTLFFLQGAGLDDPQGVLKGGGARVRWVRLAGPETLDDPQVAALIEQALGQHAAAFAAAPALSTLVKAVSPKQRPRRPAGDAGQRPASAARSRRRR